MATLTQEQVTKVSVILTRLDAQLPTPKQNRRHASRLTLRMPLQVLLLSSTGDRIPTPVDIFTRNISPSGMGFVCRRMFTADERIVVALHLDKVPPRLLLARVTFSRYVRGGLYEMGAEFLACIADPSRAARIPLTWLQPGDTPTPQPAKAATDAAGEAPKAGGHVRPRRTLADDN